MKDIFKILETLDKAKMGIMYNSQGKNIAMIIKKSLVAVINRKCEKCERRCHPAW